jgi:hypothetical protein
MRTVEIRVQGCIDDHWSSWFAGLSISHSDPGETTLTGKVTDQAALYGVLSLLRDLGLPLLSVSSAECDE